MSTNKHLFRFNPKKEATAKIANGEFAHIPSKVASSSSEYRPSKYTLEQNPNAPTSFYSSLMKAWAYMNDYIEAEYGIGIMKNGQYAVELKSKTDPHLTSIAFYNPKNGNVKAATVKRGTQDVLLYNVNSDFGKNADKAKVHTSDGTLIWLALFPEIMKDDEAIQLSHEMQEDIQNTGKISLGACHAFCDNVYRRMQDAMKTKHPDAFLNVMEVDENIQKPAQLTWKKSPVREVLKGKFVFLQESKMARERIVIEDKYNLGIEYPVHTNMEQMIPSLEPGHITTRLEKELTESIYSSIMDPNDNGALNYGAVGPAGAAKSSTAKALAVHYGCAFGVLVGSANTTEDDIHEKILPKVDCEDECGNFSALDSVLKKLDINESDYPTINEILFNTEKVYFNFTGKKEKKVDMVDVFTLAYSSLYNAMNSLISELGKMKSDEKPVVDNVTFEFDDLPTIEDILFDPEETYKKMTGSSKSSVDIKEVILAGYEKLRNFMTRMLSQKYSSGSSSNGNVGFIRVPSEALQIFKYGGVLEIQEPNAIKDPSVLTMLNNFMNSKNATLQTAYGTIKRHDKCIIILTMNPDDYIGNTPLSDSLKDRLREIHLVERPEKEFMIECAMQEGFLTDNYSLLDDMADAIEIIEETAKNKAIRGVAGLRSYKEWARKVHRGCDLYSSFKVCVLNKVTTDEYERSMLLDALKVNSKLLAGYIK